MNYAKIFAENVKRILAKRQMKLSVLIRMCGISQSFSTKLNNPERLNPSLDLMENVADKLKVPLEKLLTPDFDAQLEELESVEAKKIKLPYGYNCGYLILRDEEYAVAKRQDERNRILIKVEKELNDPN